MYRLKIFGLLAGLSFLPNLASAQDINAVSLSPTEEQTISKKDCEENKSYTITWSFSVTWALGATASQSYDFQIYTSSTTAVGDSGKLQAGDLAQGEASGGATLQPGLTTSSSQYTFQIGAQTILGTTNCSGTATTRKVIIRVTKANTSGMDDGDSKDGVLSFKYDPDGPPPPTITSIEAGNNNIKISWTASSDPNVQTYEVVYFKYQNSADSSSVVKAPIADVACNSAVVSSSAVLDDEDFATLFQTDPNVTPLLDVATANGWISTLNAYDAEASSPDPSVDVVQFSANHAGTMDLSTGLSNGVCTMVMIRAINSNDIVGVGSNLATGTPVNVYTFADYHVAQGGSEPGGFCFIATAAFGSYAHPAVYVLRGFRDHILKRSALGTALVAAYYRWSPPLARQIANDSRAKFWVQLALIPVALLALFLCLSPFLGFLLVLRLVWRNRVHEQRRPIPSAAALGLIVLLSFSAATVEAHDVVKSKGVQWALSFKGGPYLPALKNTDRAFQAIYTGSKYGANPLYTLGADIILYDGHGKAGFGGGFGFMQFVGKGSLSPLKYEKSSDTTVFNILPLTAEAFYRWSYLHEQVGIPLSPYVRAGVAYFVWWNTNGNGDTDQAPLSGGSDTVSAQGAKYGYTGTIGLALELNEFEQAPARRLAQSTGISRTSLFAEYELNSIDNLGGAGFDLSNIEDHNRWRVGLYFEF